MKSYFSYQPIATTVCFQTFAGTYFGVFIHVVNINFPYQNKELCLDLDIGTSVSVSADLFFVLVGERVKTVTRSILCIISTRKLQSGI